MWQARRPPHVPPQRPRIIDMIWKKFMADRRSRTRDLALINPTSYRYTAPVVLTIQWFQIVFHMLALGGWGRRGQTPSTCDHYHNTGGQR